jgi:hypothetical protein
METHEAINEIKVALSGVQSEGQEFVHIPALNNFLDALEKSATLSKDVAKFQHESNMEWYKAQVNFDLEMFKSVIMAGQTALKTSFLINGGAAVALLAFIGNIWNKTQTIIVIKTLANSLVIFSAGVLFVAIATGTTYLTQNFYAYKWNKTGAIVNIVSILCVIMSYLTFILGIIYMYKAFITHFL